MKLFSWNVNGIRSCKEKGLFQWLETCGGDIVGLQETKAHRSQLDEEFISRVGWNIFWAEAQKKGYSGLAIYSRLKPNAVLTLGREEFDNEGRFLALDFGSWMFAVAYFPNSQEAGARLDYKLDFCRAIQAWTSDWQTKGRQIVLCGDYNIAHRPIDLARPKENEGNPGYFPQERAWMEEFLSSGWTDSFRYLFPSTQAFSWWSYRFHAREKNIGWRIDYHCVTEGLKDRIRSAAIHDQVTGSDHVPVLLEVEL